MAAQGALMNFKVHQHPSASSAPPPVPSEGGNGNDYYLNGRVSSLEAHLQRLSTKEDIRRIERLIAEHEGSVQRWLIGIIAVGSNSLAVALIRMFM